MAPRAPLRPLALALLAAGAAAGASAAAGGDGAEAAAAALDAPWEPPEKWTQAPGCQCCAVPERSLDELTRRCLPSTFLQADQVLVQGEAGALTVSSAVQAKVCGSPTCRGAILKFWSEVRGCSQVSSWRTVGMAWMAAKAQCSKVEASPGGGERHLVLMRATLRSPTVNTSVDYSMRRAEAEVREALLEALQPATRSGAGADIELSASVAPVLRPDAKTAAKPEPEVEGPSCVQLEGSWPSDDDKHVSGQLDYVALTFEEKVTWDVGTALELRGQSAACADVDLHIREGELEALPGKVLLFRIPGPLARGCCYRTRVRASAVAALDGERGLCEDTTLDFCVQRDTPVPQTKLVGDRWLRTIFNMPVKPRKQVGGFSLESKPLVKPGSPYHTALPFRAQHELDASKHMAWVHETTGTFLSKSDAAAIVDNADGTGTLGGEPLTCTYSPEAGGSAVPCGDGMSFETDLCADKGRCSEAAQLPCGLELAVDYPGGLVLGVSGDRNPAAAGTVRTRHCGPPRLLPSTASPAGSELPLTWSEPVDMSDASARLWLCELDTLEQKCHIKGEPIGDVVEQGEDPSKWTLRLPEGARPACGRLEVLLEAEAARSRANPVSSQKTRTEFATQGDCPQFLDPMETGCWLLWDLAYRFMGTRGPTGGSDNVHFRKDLDDIGVIYTVKSRAEELWDRLEAKTYMPWCLIIPGLKEDPAEGRERAFFDYVGMGGQLYVIGGRVNVDFLHSVFDIEMSLAFSGNRQILESDSLNSTLRGSGWFQELPTLNQMACVSFPAMQGTRFGEGVVVHGIYSGREEVSDTEQLNGYCLFEVMASQGVAEYLAFDWHVDDDSARKKWATTLALLLEGNRARRPRGARRLGEAVPPAAAPGPGGRGRYPLVAAEDLPRFSRRLAAAGRPRRLAGAGCPQAEGEGRDFELTVALRCSPEQDGTEYLDAGTGAGGCEGVREAVLQSLADADSAFRRSMEGRCFPLEMMNYSLPEVVQAVSLCPDAEQVASALFDMNFACNFTERAGLSLDRFSNTSAYLEAHIVQTGLGLEGVDDTVRDRVCRKPVCRRMIDAAYQLTLPCPSSAGHVGLISHVLALARNALESCGQVQAAGGEAAVSGLGLRGAAAGSAVARTQIELSGINTMSPEEMHAARLAMERLVRQKLGLPETALGADTKEVQVAVRLDPAASDAAPVAEPGRLTGEEPVIQETTFEGSHAKNLHVVSLQPRWGSHGVDPAAGISVIFEDLISADDVLAIVRVFPTALKEVCLYLTEYGQFAFFPTETGIGGLKTASGDETSPEFGVPVPFVCQTFSVGDQASVVVSGEVLKIQPKYPLMRNTEYTVMLPRRAVKASAFASGAFQGAMFNGWPSEGAPADEEYVFTTGSPAASRAQASVSVGCGSEADCASRRDVLDREMDDVALRTACFIAWFRCSNDTSSARYCEQPAGMDWCEVNADAWNATAGPEGASAAPAGALGAAPRPGGADVLSATGSRAGLAARALLRCLPWWAWACALGAWALCAFASYRATQWICDVYRKSRMYDPYVCQVTKYLPFWATVSVLILVVVSGTFGAHAAETTYQRWVRPMSREMLDAQTEEPMDLPYFRGRQLCAFTLAASASAAGISAVASGATARFRMCYHDVGQAAALASAALALVAVLASSCGFVRGAGIAQSVAMQRSFTWTVAAAMLCVGAAGVCTALLALPLGLLVLYSRAGVGEIVSFAIKFVFYQYVWWNDESGPIGGWSGWILHIRDIKGIRGFVQALHRKQKGDGTVYLSFRASDAPVSAVHTRGIPVQATVDNAGGVHSFLGETVSLNISSPLTLVIVDVMFQQKLGEQPEKVASALWDPWCGALLDKCFNNWERCNPQNLRNVLWNPRDLLGAGGHPEPGTYVGFELNLSSDPVSYTPDIGILAFSATHLGPIQAGNERESPWDTPQRSLTMGDTVEGGGGTLRRRVPTEASAPFYSRVMYSQYGRLPRDLKAEAGASYLKSIAPGGNVFGSHRGTSVAPKGSIFGTHRGASHFWTH